MEGSTELQQAAKLETASGVDTSKFDVWLRLQALRVPKSFSQRAAKILSKHVLDKPRIKHIVPDPADPALRRIILSEGTGPDSLPEDKLLALKEISEIDVVAHDVLLDYTYWPVEKILKEILPAGCEVPSAFECIGHIAHLNLRDELLPHRRVIAQVFLDKNKPKIRTVVNKVGSIKNEFRVPEFEVLAGSDSLVTEVKQHGATFRLDYGLVYWNSRLEFEHKRLVDQFHSGQVVCDMFAGIGPFAIPAAQRGCIVYANDLNPASVKYLTVNAKLNKVEQRVNAYNMDAREFMRYLARVHEAVSISESCPSDEHAIKQELQEDHVDNELSKDGSAPSKENRRVVQSIKNWTDPSEVAGFAADCATSTISEGGRKITSDPESRSVESKRNRGKSKREIQDINAHIRCKPGEHFDHVIMNLPASALHFLDSFRGLLSKTHWKGPLPRLHCYCFKRSTETFADVVKYAESILQGSLKNVEVWTVRDVAPNKIMLCLSFDLAEEIAFSGMLADVPNAAPIEFTQIGLMKRPRVH